MPKVAEGVWIKSASIHPGQYSTGRKGDLATQIPYYGARHAVAPGISGWAQVNYPYGASEEDALQKLEYDLYYIKNMSLLPDLRIALKTISVVLLGDGAR